MSNLAKRAYGTVFKAIQRYDLSEWDCKPECDTPIYGVYHVFCDKGWQELVADQIRRLKDSGLYSATKRLYISCIVKDEAQADELMSLIDADKAELISVSTDPMKFEYPALEFIREKSGAEDCFIYYFHTKGISYYAGERTDRHFLALRRNIEAWRHMMEYFLFYKWQVAVNVLDEGYDTYGCYRLPPYPKKYYLYAGNFWWVRSDYVRRLPPFPGQRIATDRFIAEEWLYKAGPMDFSAFDTMADLYFVHMDEALYSAKRLPLGRWLRFVVRFNWVKTRKHLFGYDYKKKRQLKFQAIAKQGSPK